MHFIDDVNFEANCFRTVAILAVSELLHNVQLEVGRKFVILKFDSVNLTKDEVFQLEVYLLKI